MIMAETNDAQVQRIIIRRQDDDENSDCEACIHVSEPEPLLD